MPGLLHVRTRLFTAPFRYETAFPHQAFGQIRKKNKGLYRPLDIISPAAFCRMLVRQIRLQGLSYSPAGEFSSSAGRHGPWLTH